MSYFLTIVYLQLVDGVDRTKRCDASLRNNLLSRPQPEAVLAPVSYRSSRRRRQRKRLLLKVPNEQR